ncbi:unnamed protein product [Effrenium voratum]|nr:unnamed protein product [Effrenium voratum]
MARFRGRASVPEKAANGAEWKLVSGDDNDPQSNVRVASYHHIWQEMVAARSPQSFQDPEFPAGPRAVDGKREDTAAGGDFFRATLSEVSKVTASEEGLLCHCGQPAQLRRVQKSGPTFGRPYYACPSRSCRFFDFADEGSTKAALELEWKRFPAVGDWTVVRDEGFAPSDVRQGGVGDCWFMSALAVVAPTPPPRATMGGPGGGDFERHDLMCKLLPNLNVGAESGCHEVRLFLDGRWSPILVDDFLPTTAKQRRPDGTSLAYGRCTRRQLWVSLIEKAYAKANGAYRFISGGETSEALLELTGAPTEVVNFRSPIFDPDLFWARLVSLLAASCPVGCGTGAETLEELGLVGQHAYSVLEAQDEEGLALCGLDGRRVKVRNPWGEWTHKEQDELLAQLGAAIIPSDGCFWMNYRDFIRGFACADICFARPGWHGRSFDAEFDASSLGTRVALRLRATSATECWVMGIQPTERGKQIKKPRGYYLNDLSLLVLDESGQLLGAALGGAKRDVSCSVLLEPEKEYRVIPVSFRASRGPFVLRVYAASPVEVLQEPPDSTAAWDAFHGLLAAPKLRVATPVQRMAYDFGAGKVVVLEAPSMALGLVVNEHPSAQLCMSISAAGNHAVLRGPLGIQEGTVDAQRNQSERSKKLPKPKREPKPNWRSHQLEVAVPACSQGLAFAAVAQLDTWEFSLESVEAVQSLEQRRLPTGAFAPHPLVEDDAELQAALAASKAEAEAARIAKKAEEADAADLELAIRLSLQPALPEPVPAVPELVPAVLEPQEQPARGRWSRRKQ